MKQNKKSMKHFFFWKREKGKQDEQLDLNINIAMHCIYFDFLTMIFTEASLLDEDIFCLNTL